MRLTLHLRAFPVFFLPKGRNNYKKQHWSYIMPDSLMPQSPAGMGNQAS